MADVPKKITATEPVDVLKQILALYDHPVEREKSAV